MTPRGPTAEEIAADLILLYGDTLRQRPWEIAFVWDVPESRARRAFRIAGYRWNGAWMKYERGRARKALQMRFQIEE